MLPGARRGLHTNGLSPPNGRLTPLIRKLADEFEGTPLTGKTIGATVGYQRPGQAAPPQPIARCRPGAASMRSAIWLRVGDFDDDERASYRTRRLAEPRMKVT